MKGETFLDQLVTVTKKAKITLPPGPYTATVDMRDGVAARLLNWLYEQLPEDATMDHLSCPARSPSRGI